jgi:hypothetical protein
MFGEEGTGWKRNGDLISTILFRVNNGVSEDERKERRWFLDSF